MLESQGFGMRCSIAAIMWSGSAMQHDAEHHAAGLGTLIEVRAMSRICTVVDAIDLGI